MIISAAFLALLSTAVLSGIVCALLWRRRRLPGGLPLALLMLAVTEWATVAALEAGSSSLAAKIFWSQFEYLGSGATVALYLFFALQRSGFDAPLFSRRTLVLWILPITHGVIAFTNAWHGQLWTGFVPSVSAANQIVYQHGPAFFAMVAGMYAYAIASSILLLRNTLRGSQLHQRQHVAILIASITPLVSGLLYTLRPEWVAGINVTPMGFGASGVVFAITVLGIRLFDIAPIARNALFEAMQDAVLVINGQHRIVDFNPSAKALLSLTDETIGTQADRVLAPWPDLISEYKAGEPARTEVQLSEDPLRVIDASMTPIYDRARFPAGSLFVLRDSTARALAERKVQETHRQLELRIEEISRLQEAVRQQAIHDALTGLYNRRYLEETLPRELAASKRRGSSMSIILIDVDRFKTINDTFGHSAGDRTLQQLSTLLDRNTREGDIACRYGGDEFVLVLPDTSLAEALEKSERLRECSKMLSLDEGPQVTISIGVACSPDHAGDGGQLLVQADRALYHAKSLGRNQVCAAKI